jgi:hypothetical protein
MDVLLLIIVLTFNGGQQNINVFQAPPGETMANCENVVKPLTVHNALNSIPNISQIEAACHMIHVNLPINN